MHLLKIISITQCPIYAICLFFNRLASKVKRILSKYCPFSAIGGTIFSFSPGKLPVTEQYLVQEHERALSLQFQTAQERYEQLLNIHPDMFLRFSVGSIASYLGMSQETLSRLRTKKIGKNMMYVIKFLERAE